MSILASAAVTSASGYTGKYITRVLLAQGHRVRSLTAHPHRPNPFGDSVEIVRLAFDDAETLRANLTGVATLYNTYWVRFSHGQVTFDRAVQNTLALFRAAKDAGVRRVVHVSITNPSEDSPLPYFRGKALLERALRESALSYAILRPAVIFGLEDILINNIAWFLRKFPAFGIPGDGKYGLQPIFVEDMARLAIDAAQQSENLLLDAVGLEVFSFEEIVRLIARTIGSRTKIFHVHPRFAFLACNFVGRFVGDVVLTRDEIAGLMANLLVSQQPPTGHTRLSEWLAQNAAHLGTRYASELARHFR